MTSLESLTFFLDANLGRHEVAGILRSAGMSVLIHDDYFSPGTPDAVWLARAGQEKWIVLTKDQRIRYRELEKRALRQAGVAAFILVGKNLTGQQMGEAFLKALPKIRRLLASKSKPLLATVGSGGLVALIESQ